MLKNFDITNIYKVLKDAPVDPGVGMRIAKVTGNDLLSFYCAELDPYKKVRAHYHNHGIEIYNVISGQGLIYIGKPGEDGNVEWNKPLTVIKGDAFTVYEGYVHQLVNTGKEKLVVLFAAPNTHMNNDHTVVACKE